LQQEARLKRDGILTITSLRICYRVYPLQNLKINQYRPIRCTWQ